MELLSNDKNIDCFFKFRQPNNNALDILSKQQLRFSYPYEFNDPFDCLIRARYKGENQDWQEWFEEIKLPAENRLSIKKILESVKYDEYAFRKKMDQQTKCLLILSLSERNDHILLWSHYAENHKGICFGFQATTVGNSIGVMFDEPAFEWKLDQFSSIKGFLPVFKVKYSNYMPESHNRFKDDQKKIWEYMVTKHSDWHYESERRIILPKQNVCSQFLKYDKKALKKIIFGYRIEENYKQQVYNLASDHFQGYPIEFYQAEPKEGEYALKLNRVK